MYSITLDDTGALEAKREGMPFTDNGLTVVRHQGTLPADTLAAVRSAAGALIRGWDPDKTQGRMVADGGFIRLEIWEGTVASTLELTRLSTLDEAGKAWRGFLSTIRKTLPDGFIK